MTPFKRSISDKNNFDELLKEEIREAKELQEQKQKKRKLEDPSNLRGKGVLRDDKGFKLRLIESTKPNGKEKPNKQVDPEYNVIMDGGLRKIEPYYFTYKTFCKLRWRDRKLIDIFVSEFRDRKESYYRKCIEEGLVFVDGKVANLETIVRNGDLITHKIHRHEPPVVATPVKIISEDDDLLVIDKPSGIPVHPTGRYRFNTITKILERQLGYPVHPCNRLDKLTGGLMFLAKTPKGADQMGDELKAREVAKEYIARVVGEFPTEEVIVEKPLKTFDPRVALNIACDMTDDGAKHSKTEFKRISYDGKTSLVKCKPLTGRQHQIRVHLQYIGHPIANDPIYSNVKIWGPSLGKDGEADLDIVQKKLYEVGKTTCSQSWFYPDSNGELLKEDKCPDCETDLYTDPESNDLTLWLHAFRYESKILDEATGKQNWCYKTEFPDWAKECSEEVNEK